MKRTSEILCLMTLALSACFCPDLHILHIPTVIFDPGFEVPGEYEIFANGEQVTAGELGPDANLEWDFDMSNAHITVIDDIPRLVGVSGSSAWEDIEIMRDGEIVGKGILDWNCTEPNKKVMSCEDRGIKCNATMPLGDI